jgi:hypothetical protein
MTRLSVSTNRLCAYSTLINCNHSHVLTYTTSDLISPNTWDHVVLPQGSGSGADQSLPSHKPSRWRTDARASHSITTPIPPLKELSIFSRYPHASPEKPKGQQYHNPAISRPPQPGRNLLRDFRHRSIPSQPQANSSLRG